MSEIIERVLKAPEWVTNIWTGAIRWYEPHETNLEFLPGLRLRAKAGSWFKSTAGSVVFLSSNDEKNTDTPVLSLQEFDKEDNAEEYATGLRSFGAKNRQVRVHKRTVKVDSINLNRWFVIVRQLN